MPKLAPYALAARLNHGHTYSMSGGPGLSLEEIEPALR
jgi:hypothetical protein